MPSCPRAPAPMPRCRLLSLKERLSYFGLYCGPQRGLAPSRHTMADTQQSYKNHAQIVFLYHRVLTLLLLVILIGSVVNLTKSWGDSTRVYSASLIVALTIAAILLFVFVRVFPLKAQDRAIRAE